MVHWLLAPLPLLAQPEVIGAPTMPDQLMDQSLSLSNRHCPVVPQSLLSLISSMNPPWAGGPPIGGACTVFMQVVDERPLQNGYDVTLGGGGHDPPL